MIKRMLCPTSPRQQALWPELAQNLSNLQICFIVVVAAVVAVDKMVQLVNLEGAESELRQNGGKQWKKQPKG